jgi:hypothetical protein
LLNNQNEKKKYFCFVPHTTNNFEKREKKAQKSKERNRKRNNKNDNKQPNDVKKKEGKTKFNKNGHGKKKKFVSIERKIFCLIAVKKTVVSVIVAHIIHALKVNAFTLRYH